MLGVSPIPVREAVRRVTQEKTLEVLPNPTMRAFISPRRFGNLLSGGGFGNARLGSSGACGGRAAPIWRRSFTGSSTDRTGRSTLLSPTITCSPP